MPIRIAQSLFFTGFSVKHRRILADYMEGVSVYVGVLYRLKQKELQHCRGKNA
jgi:hypothetical protein